MRKVKGKLVLIFLFLIFFGGKEVFSETSPYLKFFEFIEKVKTAAGDVVNVKQKDNLLTITNASFVRLGKEETIFLLDAIPEKVGSSQGKGNLILLRSKPYEPLYLFFFNRESSKGVYLEVDSNLTLEDVGKKSLEEIFSKIKKINLCFEDIFKNPQVWDKQFKDKVLGGQEFRLINVSALWAEGLLPQEIIKAVEIHDHICPGLLSGYFIVRFVLNELPPQEEGMDYFVISSPVWCKDDMVQLILDTTPGNRNMVVLPLSDKEKEHLKDKNVAGIFFQFDRKIGGGKGLVVGFDQKKIEEDVGVKREEFPWERKLRLALYMAKHLNDYQKYVYVIKKFDIEKGEKPQSYFSIGLNPYKRLGLWEE